MNDPVPSPQPDSLNAAQPARSFPEPTSLVIYAAVVATSVLVAGSYFAYKAIVNAKQQVVANNLVTVRDAVDQAITLWSEWHLSEAQSLAESATVRRSTENLLEVGADREALLNAPAKQVLRDFFDPFLKTPDYLGYFLITPDGYSLASSRDENTGTQNLLTAQARFLERILAGETSLSAPMQSDVPLPSRTRPGVLVDKMPTMFAGAPVWNEAGEVIAILTLRIDPAMGFMGAFQPGPGGVTYGFNRRGELLTPNSIDPFKEQNGSSAGTRPAFLMPLHDPVAGDGKFTLAVDSALKGVAGFDVSGYHDHRGEKVVGAWLWNARLDIGIAQETDYRSAFASLIITKRAIALFTVLGACLIALLTAVHMASARRMARELLNRKQAEISLRRAGEAVRESQAFSQNVLNSLTSCIAVLDRHGEILTVNNAWSQFAEANGADPPTSTGVGLNYLAFALADPLGEGREAAKGIDAVLEGRRPEFSMEYPCNSPEQERWFQMKVVPILKEAGGAVVSHFDITAQKLTELAVRESQDRLAAIINNAVDGIITITDDGIVEYFSPGAENIFGYMATEVIGQNVNMLMPPEYAIHHDDYIRHYLETGERKIIGVGREVTGLRKNAEKFPMYLAVGEVSTGKRRLFTGIVRDVSEQKQHETELIAAKQAAEEASAAKTDFLSSVSHELRTPLNAIIGFSQLLETDETVAASTRETIRKISGAGEHLLSLVNDMLDFTAVEANRIKLSTEPVGLREMFAEIETLFISAASEKDIQLTFSCVPSRCAWVMADRMRLKQVLLNLVSNALKYNRKGGRVKVHSEPSSQAGFIRISVEDTGLGINGSAQRDLFKPFHRLGAERTEIQGTGIGLALSRRLVHLMDGSIGFKSEEARGSTFWIDLPVAHAPIRGDAPDHQEDGVPLRPAGDVRRADPLRVLVVEDNPTNQELILAQLLRLGYPSEVAGDGQSALDLLASNEYDLVLTDLHMPGMDGIELVKRIHGSKSDRVRALPVIALTADVSRTQVEVARAAGMDDYLVKPLRMEALAHMLDKWRNRRHRSDHAPEQESPDAVRRRAPGDDAVDLATLADMVGDDRDTQRRLLHTFQSTAQETLESLSTAIHRRNRTEVASLAHRLKSSARAMGAHTLADICEDLENSAQTNRGGQMAGLLVRFRVELANVTEFIRTI